MVTKHALTARDRRHSHLGLHAKLIAWFGDRLGGRLWEFEIV